MSMKDITVYATFFAIFWIVGCKGPAGPAGPAGQSQLTGSMSGIVNLYLSDGNQETDASGVNISVAGTSLSTTTDSTGQWTINGISTGTYTVMYTKTGFGMSEQQGIQFVGGGPDFLGTIILSQPPDFSVRINPSECTSDSARFLIVVTTSTFDREVLIAVGTDASVSASTAGKYLYAGIFDDGGTTGNEGIPSTALHAAGLVSGTTAYIVAYPLSDDSPTGNFYSSYFDIGSKETVYTSLGPPTSVITLTVP